MKTSEQLKNLRKSLEDKLSEIGKDVIISKINKEYALEIEDNNFFPVKQIKASRMVSYEIGNICVKCYKSNDANHLNINEHIVNINMDSQTIKLKSLNDRDSREVYTHIEQLFEDSKENKRLETLNKVIKYMTS